MIYMKINIRKRKDFSIFLTIFFTTELVELTLARCEEDSQLRSLSLEDSESVRRTHESQLRSLSLEDTEDSDTLRTLRSGVFFSK